MKYEIIPYRVWVRDDGRKASIYGAVPWTSQADKARWEMREYGFTVRNPVTGEVGACRPPFTTMEEAEMYVSKYDAPNHSYGL